MGIVKYIYTKKGASENVNGKLISSNTFMQKKGHKKIHLYEKGHQKIYIYIQEKGQKKMQLKR